MRKIFILLWISINIGIPLSTAQAASPSESTASVSDRGSADPASKNNGKPLNPSESDQTAQEGKKEGEQNEPISEPPAPLTSPESHVRKAPESSDSSGASSSSKSTVVSGGSRQGSGSARQESMTLEQNMAELIHFGQNVSEIFVANPEVADVQLNGTSSAYIFARKPGSTSVFVSDKDGNVLVRLSLRITHNLKQLRRTLQMSFPKETITVDSTPRGLLLGGTVSNAVISKDIENVAFGFLTKDEKLINAMTVAAPTQVLLKVKIAEVKKNVLNSFGMNWAAIGNLGHFTYGLLTGRNPLDVTGKFARAASPIDGSAQPNSYGFRYKDQNVDYTSLLDALDSENLATVLAEPNLTTVSGQEASFLVGGEYPYPVPQNLNITIEFKEYGIRLSFVPTVQDSNRITLKVRPEVSELDKINQLNVPGTSGEGVRVPGLIVRRAETTVELGNGQTIALAGLISASMRNRYADIPGIADLPILGALFRSTDFLKDQSELVITVTPYVVEPSSDPKGLALPTDNLRVAPALEMLINRRLNRGSDQGVRDLDLDNTIQFVGYAGFNDE
jgi:pilus assembly protein CpaC